MTLLLSVCMSYRRREISAIPITANAANASPNPGVSSSFSTEVLLFRNLLRIQQLPCRPFAYLREAHKCNGKLLLL